MATGIPVVPGALVECGDYLNEVARAHWRKLTTLQVVNTVTETDLLNGEITIDAGAMATNRGIRLTAWGDMLNNSGSTQNGALFAVRLGGTLIFSTGAAAGIWSASATRSPWHAEVVILNAGATGSQSAKLHVRTWHSVASLATQAFTVGEGLYLASNSPNGSTQMAGVATSAIDTTVAKALAFAVILPVANANLDVTLLGAIVEVV